MKVEAIHVRAPDETEVREVGVVDAIAGKGLDGDRYFFADGARPGLALTLIEGDVVRGAGLEPGSTHRQVTVTGAGLNDLVGKKFRVGSVECYGVMAKIYAGNYFNLSSVTFVAIVFILATIPQTRFVDYLIRRQARKTGVRAL